MEARRIKELTLVDEHLAEFGVEFICKHLQVAPSIYYAANKAADRPVGSGRAAHHIGRDQVGRLMRELATEAVPRLREKVFTTRTDPTASRAPDRADRQFTAERPDALLVTDLTYVPTRHLGAFH